MGIRNFQTSYLSVAWKLLVAFFIIVTFSLQAQSKKAKDRKTAPLIKMADTYFNRNEFYEASQLYGRALRIDSTNTYAMNNMAESCRMFFDYKTAERLYKKLADHYHNEYPFARFWYATMLKDNDNCVKSIQEFERFRNEATATDLETELYREKALQEKQGCEDLLNEPETKFYDKHKYNFRNLPLPVNSTEGEFAPVIFENDTFLLVTSSRRGAVGHVKDKSYGGALSDIYLLNKGLDTTWTQLNNTKDDLLKLNTQFSESSGSLTADGLRFYFTRCDEAIKIDNYQEFNCAIYVSKKVNGKWQKGERLNENINAPGQWNSQPSVSPDGNILFFVSKRPGGLGMHDIWYSTCNGDDNWGPPLNLGDRINTLFIDMTPRYYSDQKVLFFSSNGHRGRGGLDIFMAREEDGFEKIINLGVPFNSNRDDFYFILGQTKGYLSSNREGGTGYDDIYTFNIQSPKVLEETIEIENRDTSSAVAQIELPENKLSEVTASKDPAHTSMEISGTITDSITGKPMWNQPVVIRDRNGNEIAKTNTDKDGKYSVHVPNGNYVVNTKGSLVSSSKPVSTPPEKKFLTKSNEVKLGELKSSPNAAHTGMEISGVLRDSSSGKPLANQEIIIRDKAGKEISRALTDESGNYALEVPNGNYTVNTSSKASKPVAKSNDPRYFVKSNEVRIDRIARHEDSNYDRLEVSGTLKDSLTGKPLANRTLIVRDLNGKEKARMTTDAQGNYKTTLPNGTYTLHIPSKTGSKPLAANSNKRPIAKPAIEKSVEEISLIDSIAADQYPKGTKSVDVSGSVRYADNKKPASGAVIMLYDDQNQVVKTAKTDAQGNYKFLNLPSDRKYKIVLQQNKLRKQNEGVEAGKIRINPSTDVSTRTLFENIYFDFDKYDLRPEARKTLESVATYCEQNPAVQIELSSYTDSYGDATYNKVLSGKRGLAAQEYLVKKGVPQSSLVVNAQGEGKAAASNNSEIGRQLNRRIEFYVLGGSGYESPFMTEIIPPRKTLYSLAKQYNMTVEELREANGLTGNELKAYAPLRVKRGTTDHGLFAPSTREMMRNIVSDESKFTDEQRATFERNKFKNANLSRNKEYLQLIDSLSRSTTNEKPGAYERYTTQLNNTLFSIAKLYGVSVQDLMDLNALTSDTIYVNQTLRIDISKREASPKGYVVKEGDTLESIAERFSISVAELKEINPLEGYILRRNMILRLRKE